MEFLVTGNDLQTGELRLKNRSPVKVYYGRQMERFENFTMTSKGHVIAMLTWACSTVYEGPRQHDVFKYIRISK